MAMPALQNAVVSSVAPASIGKASGAFNMMRQLGGVFGVAILVAVFSGDGGYASAQLFSNGFSAAIGAAAGLSVLGAAAGLGLPGRAPEVAGVSAPSLAA
jgi:putative effector of murein hydrolase